MPLILTNEAMTVPEPGAPPPDRVIAGTPAFETWSDYESADGRCFAGRWRATPGVWRIHYTEWEYCEILEGVSIVTANAGSAGAGGRSWTLCPGDRFVIEPGFVGIWEVRETTLKRYVIHLP